MKCALFTACFVLWEMSLCLAYQPTAQLDQVRLNRGLELYRSQGCGTCHAFSKAETKGIFGPAHDALFVIAQARVQSPDYHGKASSAESYILESLLEPNAYLVPGYALTRFHMPAYTHLSQEDLDALVYLLMQP